MCIFIRNDVLWTNFFMETINSRQYWVIIYVQNFSSSPNFPQSKLISSSWNYKESDFFPFLFDLGTFAWERMKNDFSKQNLKATLNHGETIKKKIIKFTREQSVSWLAMKFFLFTIKLEIRETGFLLFWLPSSNCQSHLHGYCRLIILAM